MNEPHIQNIQPLQQENSMGCRPRRNKKTRKGTNATVYIPSFLLSPSGDGRQWMLHGVPQHGRLSTYLHYSKQGACHQGHVMHFLLATVLLALHSYQVSLTKTSCDHLETFRPPYPTLVLAGFQFTCIIFCLGTL